MVQLAFMIALVGCWVGHESDHRVVVVAAADADDDDDDADAFDALFTESARDI